VLAKNQAPLAAVFFFALVFSAFFVLIDQALVFLGPVTLVFPIPFREGLRFRLYQNGFSLLMFAFFGKGFLSGPV